MTPFTILARCVLVAHSTVLLEFLESLPQWTWSIIGPTVGALVGGFFAVSVAIGIHFWDSQKAQILLETDHAKAADRIRIQQTAEVCADLVDALARYPLPQKDEEDTPDYWARVSPEAFPLDRHSVLLSFWVVDSVGCTRVFKELKAGLRQYADHPKANSSHDHHGQELFGDRTLRLAKEYRQAAVDAVVALPFNGEEGFIAAMDAANQTFKERRDLQAHQCFPKDPS